MMTILFYSTPVGRYPAPPVNISKYPIQNEQSANDGMFTYPVLVIDGYGYDPWPQVPLNPTMADS